MIITVTMNPAVDKTLFIPCFSVNEVNRVQSVRMDPGGKGINVSKAAQVLGADTICLGILGGETGAYIRTALERKGLKCDMVCAEQTTRTNIKIVDLEKGTNTDINEAGEPVSDRVLEQLHQRITDLAKPGDTVVFAGKNPPGTPVDLLARWTRQLRAAGVRVCLDTVGEPMRLALQEAPSVIKPNQEELSEILGKTLATEQEVIEGAQQMLAMGLELVVVSMGGDGAVFVSEQGSIRTIVPRVPVVSTVGAGDSMMAAAACFLEKGADLKDIALWATATATAAVQVDGSEPAKIDLIREMLPQIQWKTI